ncbi:hypothetical protein C8Q75DRAFT_238987 [Abortiporus biennis]|nr:hypothetical protein C8Q75DRAFT_238987 [Abortiporus biennis]
MPTCTIPFEVLLEFLNNTGAAATIQVIRREEGEGNNTGPTLLINRGESVSLVLTAGQPYHYLVRQQQAEARMSAKIWRDTRCDLKGIFSRPNTMRGDETSTQGDGNGVKVVLSFSQH